MRTLLVIEDQELDGELLRAALEPLAEKHSLALRICRRGLEALEEIRKSNCLLVLLSYDMQGYITGKSLLFNEEVRRHPVMLLSSSGEGELRHLKRSFSNVVACFSKPAPLETLREALEKQLAKA